MRTLRMKPDDASEARCMSANSVLAADRADAICPPAGSDVSHGNRRRRNARARARAEQGNRRRGAFRRWQPSAICDRWLELSAGADWRRYTARRLTTSWRRSAVAREFNAPILSRGGGTSLAGQCCNVAVVLDHSKYLHDVLHIDPDRKLATVSPAACSTICGTRPRSTA